VGFPPRALLYCLRDCAAAVPHVADSCASGLGRVRPIPAPHTGRQQAALRELLEAGCALRQFGLRRTEHAHALGRKLGPLHGAPVRSPSNDFGLERHAPATALLPVYRELNQNDRLLSQRERRGQSCAAGAHLANDCPADQSRSRTNRCSNSGRPAIPTSVFHSLPAFPRFRAARKKCTQRSL
jgi:hypothetical protein